MRALLAAFIMLAAVPALAGGAVPGSSAEVVSDSVTEGRRIVSVRLGARVAEADLVRIAGDIKARTQSPEQQTLVAFYLPRMPLDRGAWASVNFAPAAQVRINGLRLEEQQQFTSALALDQRAIVGAWITDMPAPPGRLVIYREKNRTFSEWLLRSGRKSAEELVEVRGTRGSRFDPKSGAPDYFLLKATGDLELRNKERLIAVAERVDIEKPQAIVASEAPAAGVYVVQSEGSAAVSGALARPADEGTALPASIEEAAPVVTKKPRSVQRANKPKAVQRDSFGLRTVFQGGP